MIIVYVRAVILKKWLADKSNANQQSKKRFLRTRRSEVYTKKLIWKSQKSQRNAVLKVAARIAMQCYHGAWTFS